MRFLSVLTKIITLNGIPPLGTADDYVLTPIAKAVKKMSITFSDYFNFFKKDQMITDLELRSIIR